MSLTISLRGVTHSYEDHLVLKHLDLELKGGEALAVIGPSGSGKTTLLSILGLLLPPTSGQIEVDGEVVERRPDLRLHLYSWVFQTVNTLGRRTALENVALAALSRGVSRKEASQNASEALDRVGLLDYSHRPAYTLSGGELQRLCVARAIVVRPAFVLADEPTGQLDARTSSKVADALLAKRPGGVGTVIATHDIEIANSCDRVLSLRDGVLEPV